MDFGLTRRLTETRIRDLLFGGGLRWPMCRTDNLATFMCQLYKFREPQSPGALKACSGIALSCRLLTVPSNLI
jgi:hypothetical protein